MKKHFLKIGLLSLSLSLFAQINANAKILDYSEILSKNIYKSVTSSSNSFNSSLPYSDDEGYSGTYYKDGSSTVISGSAPIGKTASDYDTSYSNSFSSRLYYNDGTYSGYLDKDGSSWVISGSAPKSKTVSSSETNSSGSFSSYKSYDDGTYSGTLYKDGSKTTSKVSKSVSGRASKGINFGKICLDPGGKEANPNYSDSTFVASNMATWKYWNKPSPKWSAYQQFDTKEVTSSSSFRATWDGSGSNWRVIYAYYDDGDYKGDLSASYIETKHTSLPLYEMTPSNGYKIPYVGKHSNLDDYTIRYSLSGTVYATRYTQKYSGTVYTEDTRKWRQDYSGTVYTKDTRVWEQDYSGVAYKKIEKTLDADISSDIPQYLEEGKSITVTVTAKNNGTLPWTKGDVIKLHNLGSDVQIDEKFEIPDGVTVNAGGTISWKITLPALTEGNYEFNFSMIKDNGDGDFGNTYSTIMKVYSLKPDNGNLEVTKSDYSNGNKYYIKPGSTAEIKVDGSMVSLTNKFPTHNYVKFENESKGETLEQVTTSSGTSFKDNTISTNTFTKVNNSKLIQSTSTGINIVTNTQQIKVTGEDTEFKLHNKTSYEDANNKYGNYSDSNKFLIVDGTAPSVVGGSIDASSDSDYIYIRIPEIIEEGSGVKKVEVTYSNNGAYAVTETINPSSDGTYETSK